MNIYIYIYYMCVCVRVASSTVNLVGFWHRIAKLATKKMLQHDKGFDFLCFRIRPVNVSSESESQQWASHPATCTT